MEAKYNNKIKLMVVEKFDTIRIICTRKSRINVGVCELSEEIRIRRKVRFNSSSMTESWSEKDPAMAARKHGDFNARVSRPSAAAGELQVSRGQGVPGI